MAEIITLQSAVLPILQAAAQKIADTYGGARGDDTNWMVRCPLHDDQQASCHVKITDRLLVYCHVCGKKKQGELIQKLKDDELWVTIEQPQKVDKTKELKSNIPAHAVPEIFPRFLSKDRKSYPISKIWTYYTELGHPAFWILRADWVNEDGSRGKVAKPFSSFTKNGKDVFDLGLACDKRPLYNLPGLVTGDLNRPILVVEGEKTADAAEEIFGQAYEITTWAGGGGSWRKTDLSPLHSRDVIFWPDNDEPGVRIMLEVSRFIKGSRIVFQEEQVNLPHKWDLADPIPPGFDVFEALKEAKEPKESDESINELAYSLEALLLKWQRLEDGGGTMYVDTQSRSPFRPGDMPFRMYSSSAKLQEAEPVMETVYVHDKPYRRHAIDKYLEDMTQKPAVGITFNPTTTDARITIGDSLYLNTYAGYENRPVECDPAKYQIFIDHINGTLNQAEAVWALDWFADIFQHPGRKPGVALIFTGKPGSGKSMVGVVMASILGRNIATCVPCGAVTDSRFNGQLERKLFVCLDEVNLYGAVNKHAADNLKTWVTDDFINLNEKYKRQRAERSFHRFFCTTNVNMPLTIDMSDRRYALFNIKDTFISNHEHFNRLAALARDPVALSGLAFYFMNRQITTDIHVVPQTDARANVQRFEDPILDMVYSMLDEGHLPEELSSRLTKCEWPEGNVLIPRSLLVGCIRKRHPSLSQTRISQILLRVFQWHRSDGRSSSTQVRVKVTTPDGRGLMELKDRVFELKPIHEQRIIYESVTNTKPKWQEITFDEEDDSIDQKPVEPF